MSQNNENSTDQEQQERMLRPVGKAQIFISDDGLLVVELEAFGIFRATFGANNVHSLGEMFSTNLDKAHIFNSARYAFQEHNETEQTVEDSADKIVSLTSKRGENG